MKLAAMGAALALPLLSLASSPLRADDSAPADSFDGRLLPSEDVLVGAQVPGLLDQLHVEVGDVVAAGEEIASLHPGSRPIEVELAATRAARTASLERARTALAEIDRLLAERATLYADGLLPATDKAELETERRQAEIDLLEAQETHELDRLEHRRALVELDSIHIRAPIRGIVVERLHAVGEQVAAEERAVVRLVALDPLLVEAVLPLPMLGRVAVGDSAAVLIENTIGGTQSATVQSIEPQVDTASATFIVRLELRNPGERIPAGLRCRVRFEH